MRHLFRPARANFSLASGPASNRTTRALNRALLFAGALILLWVAVQLMPSPAPPEAAVRTEAADAGAVATNPARQRVGAPSAFRPGYLLAIALLGGGAAFAVWLRRRTGVPGATGAALTSVGSMALGPNQHLRLVRCGDEVLLLGVSAGEVALLKAYPAAGFEAALATDHAGNGPSAGDGLPPAPPAPPLPGFADLVRAYAGARSNA